MDVRLDFRRVDFRAADLRVADFRVVDFRAVDFRAVDFRAPDFRLAALPLPAFRAGLRFAFARAVAFVVFRVPVRFERFAAFLERVPAFFFGAMGSSGLWVGRTPGSDLVCVRPITMRRPGEGRRSARHAGG